jgi:hypothetical protein
MPKASKPKKHPRQMTTEEAVNHLFHPKVVKHVKNVKDSPKKHPAKKA